MPYEKPADLPKSVKTFLKGKPAKYKRQWIHVFNNVRAKKGNDIDAFRAANGVLKKRMASESTSETATNYLPTGSVAGDRLSFSRAFSQHLNKLYTRKRLAGKLRKNTVKRDADDVEESVLASIDEFLNSKAV